MLQYRKLTSLCAGLIALLFIAPACAGNSNKSITIGDRTETGSESTVNGSISVGEDSTINGSLSTVNGTIRVGDNSRLGDADTVNGSIRLGDGVTADDIESVNGSVRLGESVTVEGEISVVNGKISLDRATRVGENVSNVNGEIVLKGAEIGGDLSTVNGDVSLLEESTLHGDLTIKKPGGWGWNSSKRKPRIVVGPGSVVAGRIDVRREVELFISDSAEVGGVVGKMDMEDATRFSGDRP